MPKLFSCPDCEYTRSWKIRRHHRKCKRCRKEWSVGEAHPVKGFRLSRQVWLNITDSFVRDGRIMDVQDESRVAYPTAHKAVTLLRHVMCEDTPSILRGICEADETYVGGSWKNKAVHIRKQGTKRGRGTSKQPIFGIIERAGEQNGHTSRVRVWLTPDTKNKTLMPHIRQTVELGSTIYTDGRKGYRKLPSHGYTHDWVDHDANEYVRGDVHTQNIDGYWGQLKTHLDSIGGIRKHRLHLFIGEHVWRFNNRHLTRKEQRMKLYSLLTRIGGS